MDVLIVGAGPTGLTLACDLARRGVDVRIVERSAAPSVASGSRGKGIQPRSQEVFDDLGVLPALRAVGTAYPPMRGYADGAVTWDGRMQQEDEPRPTVPYPNSLLVPQWLTEVLLRDRLAELGVEVERAELLDFADDGAGVTLRLVGPGGTATERADYLVGADGGRSGVRKALGVSFDGETTETQRLLIGDVAVAGLDRDHWHFWGADAAGTVGLCPLSGTELFQFSAPVLDERAVDVSPDGLRRMFAERSDATGVHLGGVAWVSLYRTNVRLAGSYRQGRVFLAGDAAHVHSPAGGQGLNTGVQDAYNLGWKLAAVLAGAPEELLASYEAERLPVAAEVLGLSSRYHNEGVFYGSSQRGNDTKQLGIHYRGGPLSVAAGEPWAVQAGDRAPDAPCTTADGVPATLFAMFRGPHATLLTFGAMPVPALPDGVRVVPVRRAGEVAGVGDVMDDAGQVAAAYGAPPGGGIALVRPDGYLGVLASDEAPLREYLRAVSPARTTLSGSPA